LFCSSFLLFFFQISNPLSFCLFWLQTRAVRGPIFEDGPGFENAFRLFHGRDGVVPLAEKQTSEIQQPQPATEVPTLGFHPLSASAATISLSSFGAFGPFSFDGLMAMRRNNNNNAGKSNKRDSKKKEPKIEKDTQSEINPNVSFSSLLLLPETSADVFHHKILGAIRCLNKSTSSSFLWLSQSGLAQCWFMFEC
jgi:hypothetical protein